MTDLKPGRHERRGRHEDDWPHVPKVVINFPRPLSDVEVALIKRQFDGLTPASLGFKPGGPVPGPRRFWLNWLERVHPGPRVG